MEEMKDVTLGNADKVQERMDEACAKLINEDERVVDEVRHV